MIDEDKIRKLAAGRSKADELAEFYIDAASELRQELGPDGVKAFFERLRDNLIGICPLPEPVPERKELTAPPTKDYGDTPRGYVAIDHDGIQAETDKAYGVRIDGDVVWLPKSQVEDIDDEVATVTIWIAEQKELV